MKPHAIHERALMAAVRLEKDLDGSLSVSGQRFALAAISAVETLFPDDSVGAVERMTADRPTVARAEGDGASILDAAKPSALRAILDETAASGSRKNDGDLLDERYKTWMCVPVAAKRETRLAVVVAREKGKFDEVETAAAAAFQTFLSQALRNARSRNKKAARADEDARHRALLAAQWSIGKRAVEWPGFRQESDLTAGMGSDVGLAYKSGDDRFLMCSCDVTANDPERLAGLVYLDAWFSILSQTTLDARGMLQRLNSDLLARGAECYASVALARYVPSKSTVEIAGCGNACAIAFSHGEMEARTIEFGPAAGVAADTRMESRQVAVGAGDIVCVFTDGLPSTRRKNGDLYGTAALADIVRKNYFLPADALADKILKTVAESGERNVNADDRTLQVLKIG